jgi:hypothetical protein
VWGDGSAVRSYTYVDDMVDGIYRLMQSDLEGPVNIGNPESRPSPRYRPQHGSRRLQAATAIDGPYLLASGQKLDLAARANRIKKYSKTSVHSTPS